MDNFNKEYHRETHTIACNYSRSKDNVATNMLDSLVAGSLIVAGGLLLGPLGMGHRTKRFFQWSGKMGERF